MYVRKFENSDENRNSQCQLQCLSAGQTMSEREKSSDLGEISAVTVRLGVAQLPTHCSMRVVRHLQCRNISAIMMLDQRK